MKFTIERDQLLKPLQQLSGVASAKSFPILGNVLIRIIDNETEVIERNEVRLQLTCADSEVELQASLFLPNSKNIIAGAVTVSATKLLDICKSLEPGSPISLELIEDHRLRVTSGSRSRYHLPTLPVRDFPNIESWHPESDFQLTQGQLNHLINMTKISMPVNDVRFYLNGMLFDAKNGKLRTVTTDGHRMSSCLLPIKKLTVEKRVIIPRKTITELNRLLSNFSDIVILQLNESNLRIILDNYIFTSKLIEGNYPDYTALIPRNVDKVIEINREEFKQICSRVAIVSSDPFKGIRLQIEPGQIRLTNANNKDNEEGEEFLSINYQGTSLDLGFNVHYLIDICNTMKGERIRFSVRDNHSSMLIEDCEDESTMFILMPVRL